MLWLGDVDAVFGFMQDLGRKKKKLYLARTIIDPTARHTHNIAK
jgi:hypothetical protein